MARISRLLNPYEATIYHVMSRSALEGFPLGDVEKDYLLKLIKLYSQLFFVEVLGFCLMGNHFHLLVRVFPGDRISDDEIKQRIDSFYDGKRVISDLDIPKYREKLSSLPAFMKEVKQRFTVYFNRNRKRWGFFWGQRFKSVIVEDGDTLKNCLAYIDLNPIRAGIVEKPDDYRWNTLGYLLQTGNKDGFLSIQFGLPIEEKLTSKQRIRRYRQFVYEVGSLEHPKGKSISKGVLEQQKEKSFEIDKFDRFRNRTRYFTDSGVIGSRKFVNQCCLRFDEYFESKKPKKPIPIQGLEKCFSMKRLATSTIY